ncbi:hypothetical protein AMATHDRAFT_5747 [Amanita thiersii Skay4041]|uniref:Amidohydrolase-related domain-containing protein n=1 Tax=Amanita thiersii Skay4041 TaxID=703135 RepID=A0A2A9NLD9_9AGAR|nr:hypothetical protein AMATHDRAFT_5747 [Amanita thiersii Skay4041]
MKGADSQLTLPAPLQTRRRKLNPSFRRLVRLLLFLTILTVIWILSVPTESFSTSILRPFDPPPAEYVLRHRKHLINKCQAIRAPAGAPSDYRPESRIPYSHDISEDGQVGINGGKGSERYVPGTPPTLLKNAKIWTGALNGTYVISGDILMDKGVIISVGPVSDALVAALSQKTGREKLVLMDLAGKWVTPGLVDLHSHIGVQSSPELNGNMDVNSHKAPILPWLRSVDGLNTHDESYALAVAGGVTTAQILPGSANNIGGQAFLIKLRPTSERSTSSKVLEPPEMLHYTNASTESYVHWRHMKHACGENPDRVYSQARMDAAWNFRHAYNEARKIKETQDQFCEHVEAKRWDVIELEPDMGSGMIGRRRTRNRKLSPFPEDLQWESLVDVLRGRVKLSIHCYEAVDLDAIIRLSNEFQFPVSSFHHATETYLVPDLLKQAWGGTPSVALFAINARKKREAYRGSEFAPRILADNDIPVILKSDHPVLNSRHLLFEAQQAHYYGLSAALALSAVTTVPAKAAGMDHRIGVIAEGYDADIAIWDSHPLALGATPVQVFIDGIAQIENPHEVEKRYSLQVYPQRPNWDCEAAQAVKWDGLPPLGGSKRVSGEGVVRFERVQDAWVQDHEGNIVSLFNEDDSLGEQAEKIVVLRDGKVHCIGHNRDSCLVEDLAEDTSVIDLAGGSIAPALTTFGSPLGLVEIRLEPAANDGNVLDPLTSGNPPAILGNTTIIRAVDGLQFETRHALLAHRSGVTAAITAPVGSGFLLGVSTAFDTGAPDALGRGAVIQEDVAIHVAINPSLDVSVSTQMATLRRLVFEDAGKIWERVRKGDMTLAVHVDSADIMVNLIKLKANYEETNTRKLKMTFVGATEAHLIARKIAKAGLSVIVTASRPYPSTWDKRRFLPGPPLSADTLVTTLIANGINVAIGVTTETSVRNTRFEIAWAMLNSNGKISKSQALALVTVNLERALGVDPKLIGWRDIVAYRGGSVFDMESKVLGVASKRRRVIETFGCKLKDS